MAVRGNRKTREGRVISAGMDKTIVVQVERRVRHPLYGKEIRKKTKLYAHDEDNQASVGQWVQVMEKTDRDHLNFLKIFFNSMMRASLSSMVARLDSSSAFCASIWLFSSLIETSRVRDWLDFSVISFVKA